MEVHTMAQQNGFLGEAPSTESSSQASGTALRGLQALLDQEQAEGSSAFRGWRSPWVVDPSDSVEEGKSPASGGRLASEAAFLLTVSVLPVDTFRVVQFEGSEEVSRPYEFDITVVSSSFDLGLEECLGQPAQLELRHVGGGRRVCGIVERAEQLEVGLRQSVYRFRIVPRLSLLAYTRRSRIFRGLSSPDIVHWVLTSAGYPKEHVRVSLIESYAPRDYCVQYQESDLAFVSRLLEEEGIFFFFEHAVEGEVLILADSEHVHPPLPETPVVHFREKNSLRQLAEPAIHQLGVVAGLGAGKVTLRDYRFKQPSLDLTVEANSVDAALPGDPGLEVFCFPGEYVDPKVGERLARVRLEELACQQRRVSGLASVFTLQPGYAFLLDHHPRSDCNREYFLVRVQHKGVQPQSLLADAALGQEQGEYEARWEGIPAELPFRPVRRTPRPVIPGLQTARVEAAGAEEIHCDVWGRVLVRFMWEGLGAQDSASCWVRVSQAWAGKGFGTFFLPRAGQEVLVQFLEGDPDRPVIVGRVHNDTQRPPYALPSQKTCSGIRTSSTPGGDGYNELRFEDLSGREEIRLRAQRDLTEDVLRNQTSRIGQDIRTSVGRDREGLVGRDEQWRVEGNRTDQVGGNEQRLVQGSQAVIIQNARAVTVNTGSDALYVQEGARVEDIQGDRTVRVRSGAHHTVVEKGPQLIAIAGCRNTEIDGSFERTAITQGSSELLVAGDRRVEVTAGNHSLEVLTGMAGVAASGGVIVSSDQGSITLAAQQELGCEAQGTASLRGRDVLIEATDVLVLKVGPSELRLTRDGISLHGPTLTGVALGSLTLQGIPITLN